MNSFKDKHTPYRLRSGDAPVHTNNQNITRNKNFVFDSQGPTGKARGTSSQLADKYLALGRESAAVGDSVLSEYFFQYAEHYRRLGCELNCHNKSTERVSDSGNSGKISSVEQRQERSLEENVKKSQKNYRRRPVRSEESKEPSSGIVLSSPICTETEELQ